MKIAVPKETKPREKRVALTPEVVKSLLATGFECIVETGAGTGAFLDDALYAAAGAVIAPDAASAYAPADVVIGVNAPLPREIALMKKGSALISFMYAASNPDLVAACVKQGVSSFSMDAIPRISRAQRMDALSSQANLGGYKAVLVAANALGKVLPLLMTAAGTIRPATVVIMGAGVAGLQAVATAKRLGAIVEVSDIRPETKEQVESLGGKFIEVTGDKSLKVEGGYVKEVSPEFLARQKQLVAQHVEKADIVITTAQVSGKKAPVLVTMDTVERMRPGSVIVDMAVEQGGNCEGSELDKVVVKHGVTIIGESNLPGLLPRTASDLYARNAEAFLTHVATKNGFAWDMSDEITKGSLITHQGKAVHPGCEPAKP
jgi:NAD(P) transhydrogenase subunit alpha